MTVPYRIPTHVYTTDDRHCIFGSMSFSRFSEATSVRYLFPVVFVVLTILFSTFSVLDYRRILEYNSCGIAVFLINVYSKTFPKHNE